MQLAIHLQEFMSATRSTSSRRTRSMGSWYHEGVSNQHTCLVPSTNNSFGSPSKIPIQTYLVASHNPQQTDCEGSYFTSVQIYAVNHMVNTAIVVPLKLCSLNTCCSLTILSAQTLHREPAFSVMERNTQLNLIGHQNGIASFQQLNKVQTLRCVTSQKMFQKRF